MSELPYNKDEIKYSDPQARREYMRAWHKARNGTRSEYLKTYRQLHRDRLNSEAALRRKEHPEVWRSYYEKHKDEIKLRAQKWLLDNAQRARSARDRRRAEIRKQVFDKLGGVECVVCGCDILRLLQINHKNGGGGKEYKERGYDGGLDIYRRILDGSRATDDLEVMCRVCNIWYDILLRYGPDVANQFIIVFEPLER